MWKIHNKVFVCDCLTGPYVSLSWHHKTSGSTSPASYMQASRASPAAVKTTPLGLTGFQALHLKAGACALRNTAYIKGFNTFWGFHICLSAQLPFLGFEWYIRKWKQNNNSQINQAVPSLTLPGSFLFSRSTLMFTLLS